MKVKGAFFNIPGHGHVNPTLAIVKELVDRGETIDYYCTEEFRANIEKTGANFIPMPFDLIKAETFANFILLNFFSNILESTLEVMPFVEQEIAPQRL